MNAQASIIKPLSEQQQQQVVEQTHAFIKKADQLFNLKLKPVEIVFDLKGKSAGMYRVRSQNKGIFRRAIRGSQTREIRYNSFIFSKYFDDNVETTVPHEVAHYISDMLFGLNNIRPHGREWKNIMLAFDADTSVTADYDLSGIPQKRQNRHTYLCGCREHQISTVRHNKILNKQYRYFCKTCKQVLQYKKQACYTQ